MGDRQMQQCQPGWLPGLAAAAAHGRRRPRAGAASVGHHCCTEADANRELRRFDRETLEDSGGEPSGAEQGPVHAAAQIR